MIKPYKRVQAVGLEFEGGWSRTASPAVLRLIHHDGSVVVPNRNDTLMVGEIAAAPCHSLEYIQTCIKENQPTVVNKSCGFHIHISFSSPGTYSLTLDKDFTKFLVDGLMQWAEVQDFLPDHPIWSRLRGENQYCRLTYAGNDQVMMVRKDYDRNRIGNRYTAVNYCYGIHGTMEVRVLPMFETAEESFAAVQEVLRLVNKFLYLKRDTEVLGELTQTAPSSEHQTITVSV